MPAHTATLSLLTELVFTVRFLCVQLRLFPVLYVEVIQWPLRLTLYTKQQKKRETLYS